MNRPLTFVTALLIHLAFCFPLAAQRKDTVVVLPFSRAPYQVGERLTYNVSFSNFATAAHIEMLVAGRGNFFNRDGLELRAHVETTGVVNAALYSLNNDYTTYIDPESGLPFRSQQVIREGARTADTSNDYNLPVGVSAIPARVAFSGPYDFLSALYRLRALPLIEASYFFTVRQDTEQYEVELQVLGRQLVKTNVGSFNTIATQLRIRNNQAADKYRVRIYFSDDERHVPVLLTARHSAGEIRAELASSELPSAPLPTNPVETTTPLKTVPKATTPAGATLPTGLPFSVGEQLTFNVFLGNMTQAAGTSTFQVRQRAKYFNRDGLLLAVQAQTTNAAQRLFFVNDQINTYVDPTTLLPFRIEMNLREGSRRVNKTLTIDQDRGNASTDKGVRIEIPVGTHDIVSVLYALRSFNLAPPKRNAVSFLIEDRPRTLFITSLKRETIELGGQKIPAVQLSLTTDDPQSDKYSLRLWVSDDSRRLPLRITAKTELGPLRADLAIIPVTRQ
ncbi:MAG: DUF3108 domain-containing protein [Acidobacteria bacterium]|nr:DUF3108 domain-containing protein [Acidobacteriota bacterium]